MMSDASSEDDGGVGARRKSHTRGRKRKPASDEVLLESVLMGYLIQQFCWGFYSASEIQRLASFLKQDLQAAKAAGEDGTFIQLSMHSRMHVHAFTIGSTCPPPLPALHNV